MVGIAPDPAKCVAYYKCEDNTDSSSYGNDATDNGTVSATGIIDNGRDFDGVNDSWELPLDMYNVDLNGADAVSYSMWIRREVAGSHGLVYSNHGATGTQIQVQSAKIGVGGRSQTSDSFQYVLGSTVLSTGVFYHVVAILDFANSKVISYIDKVKDLDNSVSFGSSTLTIDNASTYSLGFVSSSNLMNGIIDEVLVYRGRLTQDNVDYLNNEGAPGTNQQYPFGAVSPAINGIKLGDVTINKVMLGSIEIKKVYQGIDTVYENV